MTDRLLDPDVLSELRRPKPDRNVAAFVRAQFLDACHVGGVAPAEIRFGIEQVPGPERQADLQARLESSVRPMFAGRVLPISEDVMPRWRSLVEEGCRMRNTFSQPDLIIAATALHHGMTVVSRDAGGFARAGVSLLDPWQLLPR